jgi:hypothetical protein
MKNDLLERLGASNPVPEPPADALDADALLARILAQPRGPAPRRQRPRRAIAAVVVAGSLIAGVLAAALSGGDSLADRAYAASLPGSSVVHEVVVTEWRHLDEDAPAGSERLEAWYHPADGRARRLYDETGDRVDVVVAADGTLRLRGSDAGPHWTGNPNPAFRRKNQTDFLHEFRRAYEGGRLEEVGEASFAGRDAVAYRVKAPQGVDEEQWYVDPESGRPLGSTRLFEAKPASELGNDAFRGQLVTRRLVEYEQLPATAANLRLLDAPEGEIEPTQLWLELQENMAEGRGPRFATPR